MGLNMKRIDAIKQIMDKVKEEDIVIASTGMIAREVYQVKDRDRNFYMMGSMGNALSIGIGMALNRPDLLVFVINGDASVLMSLGTLVTHTKLCPPNLFHIILDNNCHASTGGQKTSSDKIEFTELAPNTYVLNIDKAKGDAPRIPLSGKQIKERFMRSLCE